MHSKGHPSSKPAKSRPQAKPVVHPVAQRKPVKPAAIPPQRRQTAPIKPSTKRQDAPKASQTRVSQTHASVSSSPSVAPSVAPLPSTVPPAPIIMYMTMPNASQYVPPWTAAPMPIPQPVPLYVPATAGPNVTKHFSLTDASTWNVASAKALVHAKTAAPSVTGGRQKSRAAAERFLLSLK